MKIRVRGKFMRRLAAAYKAFQNSGKVNLQNVPPKAEPVISKYRDEKDVTVQCLKREYCSGCGACMNLCPVQAITMEMDDEGFWAPVVDEAKCTHCGLCKKRCPSLHPVYKNNPQPTCYAAYAEDEIREKSSSGGIFTVLAEYILDQGGYVCGATMTDDFKVEHTIIHKKEDLDILRKSKYVQSNTKHVYTEIRELLKKGETVFFCGCPCQVAGLYAALDKVDCSNLYSADLMCHGSPSPGLFERYLESHYGKDNLSFVGFREKDYFGWSTEMTVQFKDGEIQRATRTIDPFYKAFLPCISTRAYCGNCEFSRLPRQGDITLADFWGAERYDKKFSDNKGVSIVSVNSPTGEKLWNAIRHALPVHDALPLEYVLKTGQPFAKPFASHPARKQYFNYIRNGASLEKAYYYAVKRKFDVAVTGVWYGCNYGSVATYYGLHEILRSFGLNVLMVDKPFIVPNDFEHGDTHSRRFAQRHYEISRVYKLRELASLNEHVDTFVIGSDQVWNRGISRNFGMANYFDFVDDNKKKISYAASFGHNKDFSNQKERLTISEYMKRFDGISVREADGVKICRDVYGVDAVQVLDPVFAAGREIYDELAAESNASRNPIVRGKYIAAYILDPTPEKREALLYVSNRLGLPIVNMLDGLMHNFDQNRKNLDLENVVENLETEDWIYYIKNSEFVISDSCHGLSFAILYNKPIIGIANICRGVSRFHSLLDLFGLQKYYVTDAKQILTTEELFDPIEYEEVNRILARERERSIEWLRDKLFSPKELTSAYCAYPIWDKRLGKENKQ